MITQTFCLSKVDRRRTEESAESERGRKAGRVWALERAMPSELEWATELAHERWISVGVPDDSDAVWPTLYSELTDLIPDAPDEPWQIDRDPSMVAFFEAAGEAYEQIRQVERAASDTSIRIVQPIQVDVNRIVTAESRPEGACRTERVGGGTRNKALRPFDASPAWGSPQVRERIDGNPVREVGTTDLWLPAA